MEFITNIEARLKSFDDRLNIYACRLIDRPEIGAGGVMGNDSESVESALNINYDMSVSTFN